MNKVKQCFVLSVVLLFATVIQSFAVPGLQLSLQCSNVVLSWPTVDGSGTTYMIRRRPDLTTNSTWTVIADYYSAASGTNMTTYTDEGVVTNAICDDGGGDMEMMVRGGSLAGHSIMTSLADLPALPTPTLPPGFNYITNGDGSVVMNFDPTAGGSSGSSGSRHFGAMTEDSGPPGLPGTPPIPDDETSTNAPISPMFYEVVPEGVTLYGLTNGQVVSGVLKLPVEVANSGGGILETLTLQDNYSPIASSIHTFPYEQPVPLMTFDTTGLTNGIHYISLYAQLTDPGDGDENSAILYDLNSPQVAICVSNEISFPDWVGEFGELTNSLLITATSAHTNASYTVDVYGQTNNYIGSFAGTITNGQIYIVWDLIDANNVLHTDNSFSFNVTTVYSDPETSSAKPLPTYHTFDSWTAPGDWVVVNQQDWQGDDGAYLLDSLADSFVRDAHIFGLNSRPVNPTDSSESYRIEVDVPNATTEWTAFRSALYNPLSRNLFYLGHGTPNGLGKNPSNTNRFITATEIGTVLANIPAGLTNKHKFRFVCLDGCNTASGTLPEAFGVIHKEDVQYNYYGDNSLRPNAFVGWKNEVRIAFAGSIATDHVNFFSHFQFGWLQGMPLKGALDYADGQADVGIGFSYSDMIVFGYWGLKCNAYNR